jgi:hypothetical protein
MKGANEYANMFKTGQHGRLYLVAGSHARGNTFHIFVLPVSEVAIPNHDSAPLNKDTVEVYGITGGQPGWTETYGWLHRGRWIEDFEQLCVTRRNEIETAKAIRKQQAIDRETSTNLRKSELLANY